MSTKLFNRKPYKPQSLISLNKIKPEIWRIDYPKIIKALIDRGYDIKKIKKVRYLKHQICISYWDEKGGVCSGFFSYRIFERWQYAVQQLVQDCQSLYQIHSLTQIIEYEFARYPYSTEMEAAINDTIVSWTFNITEFARYQRNYRLAAS
jgi:hypothetical protein